QKNRAAKIPFVENDVAMTITFHDYGKDDPRTSIVIDHNPTPFADETYSSESSYFPVQFELIDPYFQVCLRWQPSEDLSEFLVNAGRLAHAFARLQPVGKGNSAIVEWMIRGLAKTHHVELGPFNQSEQIGWDFKAFLTPDREEYAQWFAEKAF